MKSNTLMVEIGCKALIARCCYKGHVSTVSFIRREFGA